MVNQNNKHRLEHLCNDLSLNTNKNGLADASTVQEISQSLLVNMDRGLLINFTHAKNTQKIPSHMSSSNMCATKASKQSLGFLRRILHTMSHVSTDLNNTLISSSLSAFISKIHYPRLSHRPALWCLILSRPEIPLLLAVHVHNSYIFNRRSHVT